MIVCRTFTLLFLMCITACGVCSSLFPLFRRNYDVPLDSNSSDTTTTLPTPAPLLSFYHRREVVYYWYTENTTAGDYPSLSYSRNYNSARSCETNKMYFVVSSALSTAATSLGGIACVMSAAWIYAGFDSCMHSFIVFVTFLSFACYVVTVALVAFLYTNDTCKDSANRATALKNANPKFDIVEGFILLCIAAGGMLIALVAEALSFCMCTNTDDYCGGRPRDTSDSLADDRSVVLSDGSVASVHKPLYCSGGGAGAHSSISRSRGEMSMSRRSSAASLSRNSSSSSISSSRSSSSYQPTYSSRSSRPSRSGHRRPLR